MVGESIDRSLHIVGLVEIVVITMYTIFQVCGLGFHPIKLAFPISLPRSLFSRTLRFDRKINYSVLQCLLFARDWFDHSLPSWILYASLLLSDALGFIPPWILFIFSQHIRYDVFSKLSSILQFITVFPFLSQFLLSPRRSIFMNYQILQMVSFCANHSISEKMPHRFAE